MRPRVLLGLLGLLLPALAAVPVGTANADTSGDRSTRIAARALSTALDVLSGAHGRDLSAALRELARRLPELDAADRRTAERILARPTDGPTDKPFNGEFGWTVPEEVPLCGPHVCVHYVASTDDAATPEQVQTTLDTFEHVWATEVDGFQYRAPKSDGTAGGNGLLDIYLANTGPIGVYGYCTSDDPAMQTRRDVSGYCVVDNDFAEFPGDPLSSLQVTAAHEFFHAVQSAYDWTEDLWMMESTAAWMEDEVYDDSNDNYQYFKVSPLGHPGIPLDYFESNPDSQYYYPQYGGWVFWKFLSESYGADIVRDVWNRAAGSGYSLSALRGALTARGTTFTDVFAKFGAVNRYPGKVYSEGSAYPAAPLAKTFTLSNRRPAQKALKAQLSHLTNLSVRYRPARTLRARALRVALNMPDLVRGSAATVVVHFRNGDLSRRRVRLDRFGAGQVKVPFTRRKVAAVDLTLTDASTRYNCWQDEGYYFGSCYGIPRDDQLTTVFAAKTVR